MKRLLLRNMSVSARLAALLIVASLLPLCISAFLEIREARRQQLESTQKLLVARVERIAREFDSIHVGYQRSTRRVADLPAVAAYCASAPAARSDHAARLQGIFSTFPRSDPDIRGLALIDAGGRIAIATDARLVGQDVSARVTVGQVLQGQSVISGVYVSQAQDRELPTVAYLEPVRDAKGTVQCAVALWVHASAFWRILKASHAQVGPDSFAVLYDDLGIRIGHSSRQETVFRPAGTLDPQAVEAMVATRRFGSRTREYLDKVLAFPEGFDRARAKAPDTAVFRGFVPSVQRWNYGVASRLKAVHWTVFYLVPEANLRDQLAAITRDKLLFALVIIVVAGSLGLVFSTSILRPFRAQEEALRLSHDALRKRADELEAGNRDLEAFAFSVSHDLRAPLQVIDGFGKILLSRHAAQLDDRGRHFVERMCASTSQMNDLVEGLLKLSRLGRKAMDLREVDAGQLVAAVVAEVLEQYPGMAGCISVGSLPAVLADEVLLRQVFANLLSNACKFAQQQEQPRIEVGCEERDGEQVWFVRDNGVGFDPAYAAKLFEPFQRLHGEAVFAGSGIGLSIVQRIVQRHGGRVWAQAAPGQGAAFYFTLAARAQTAAL